MVHLRYNTKLNTKPKIFKFYTPWELFAGAIMSVAPVMVTVVTGAQPNPGDAIIVFALYTAFLVYFKVGKPEGYLEHLLRHLFTPSVFRAGFKSPQYPVCTSLDDYVEQLTKTPEDRKEELIEIQKNLVDVGVIRVSKTGEYLKLNPEDPAAAQILNKARNYLSQGKVLGVDDEDEDKAE